MSGATLFLHGGHPKTGSSALQSAFALSIDALADHGIHYPRPVKLVDARAGRITSGNFNPAKLVELYDRAVQNAPVGQSILLSNEACFRIFRTDQEQLKQLLGRGVDITMILFLRDPLDQAASAYAQGVKRGGVTQRFVLGDAPRKWLDRVAEYLDICERLGLRLVLRNYSRMADRLLPETEAILGVPPGTLTPPGSRVNRSLARAELALMRELNASLGKEAASHVADALCNELPDIPSDPPDLRRADYDASVTLLKPVVEALNERIPAEAEYRIAPYDQMFGGRNPADRGGLVFTPEQLKVIAGALARIASERETSATGAGPTRPPEAHLRRVLRHLRALVSGRR